VAPLAVAEGGGLEAGATAAACSTGRRLASSGAKYHANATMMAITQKLVAATTGHSRRRGGDTFVSARSIVSECSNFALSFIAAPTRGSCHDDIVTKGRSRVIFKPVEYFDCRNNLPGVPMSSQRSRAPTARADQVEALLGAGREQSDATMMFLNAVAQRFGLSLTEQNAISVIDRLGPLSAGEIAAHTGLATASVTSLIDRLEAKGFARRVRDAQDRRRVFVELRPERASSYGKEFDPLRQSFARLLRGYRDDERAVILDCMVRITALMREEAVKAMGPIQSPLVGVSNTSPTAAAQPAKLLRRSAKFPRTTKGARPRAVMTTFDASARRCS
jgi:DNA-binding MarR family transcriptional regulator